MVHEKMLNVIIREMPIKTTMRYNFIAIRMAIIKPNFLILHLTLLEGSSYPKKEQGC